MAVNQLSTCPLAHELNRVLAEGAGTPIQWSDATTRVGFIETSRSPIATNQTLWIAFCRAAQAAAEYSGLPKSHAQGLIGAMREIEENIHLHSQRARDGVVGYRATREEFEFAIADNGIGVLASLRQSPHYANLLDPGTAIRLALTDGESRFRHENTGRGYGFHDLFVGLANLNCRLRFRSEDHAMTIDGTTPSLMRARLSQGVRLQGFVSSVACRLSSPSVSH